MRIAIACDNAKTKYYPVEDAEHDAESRTAKIKLKKKYQGISVIVLENVTHTSGFGISVLNGTWKSDKKIQCRAVL